MHNSQENYSKTNRYERRIERRGMRKRSIDILLKLEFQRLADSLQFLTRDYPQVSLHTLAQSLTHLTISRDLMLEALKSSSTPIQDDDRFIPAEAQQ